ncbi:hypothetical protein WJX84_003516 [Apatococcus fuscideae]|uniref:Uncharacterized protein n=1 Tax=Apatococcus fuscideae TaxID=2026836 RepID=A0AAW1TDI2_9CHLO
MALTPPQSRMGRARQGLGSQDRADQDTSCQARRHQDHRQPSPQMTGMRIRGSDQEEEPGQDSAAAPSQWGPVQIRQQCQVTTGEGAGLQQDAGSHLWRGGRFGPRFTPSGFDTPAANRGMYQQSSYNNEFPELPAHLGQSPNSNEGIAGHGQPQQQGQGSGPPPQHSRHLSRASSSSSQSTHTQQPVRPPDGNPPAPRPPNGAPPDAPPQVSKSSPSSSQRQ